MFDLLLENATIIDGSGGKPYIADLGISGGKIAAIGPRMEGDAAQRIQCAQRVVTPGFIDIHRHADAALFRKGFGEIELRQGITTIVNGNCGMSIAPLSTDQRAEILQFLSPVIGSLPHEIAFVRFSEYTDLLRHMPLMLNVGMLAGSGTMRAAAAGYHMRHLDKTALRKLHESLQDAIDAGACGVSIGLSYLPDLFFTAAELAEALAPMQGGDLPLVCHVRGEGDLLYDAVHEAIGMAKTLRVALQISHFKCIGRHNWGTQLQKTIRLIDQARQEGMDIRCDLYPWTAGSTQMACLLPPFILQDGFAVAAKRLSDPRQRALCKEAMQRPGEDFENIVLGMGWQSIYICDLKKERNRWCIGKNVEEIAAARNVDPFSAAVDLLIDEAFNVTMVDFITCEEDIATILRLPYSCVISDTVYADSGRPHPRSYGNIAQLIREYVYNRAVLTLEQAIQKVTSLPAQALRLGGKGLLRPGYDADIVMMHENGLRCDATYLDPARFASGIDMVCINGRIVLVKDTLTGIQSGTFVSPRPNSSIALP